MAVMGRALVVQGHFDRAIPILAGAIGPLEKAGEWLDLAFSIAYHGVAVTASGKPADGLAEEHAAVERAKQTKSPTILAGCYIVLGFQAYLTRDIEAFREGSRLAVETGRLAGNALMTSVGLGYQGWALGLLGQFDEAEQRVAESNAEAEKIGGRLVAADWIAAGSAEAALTAGKLDEAVARAQAAIEKARAIGGIFGEGVAQRTWGVALARMDPPQAEAADEHLAAALEMFEAGGCATEVAHTNHTWGVLLRDRGDISGATQRLELAAEAFKAAGLTKQAKEALAVLRGVKKAVHA
jgi:tetratricopeptide (TPR) repeat protein